MASMILSGIDRRCNNFFTVLGTFIPSSSQGGGRTASGVRAKATLHKNRIAAGKLPFWSAFIFILCVGTTLICSAECPEPTPPASGSSSLPLQGTVHRVSPSTNIQRTINSAAAGDTIFFNAGVYNLSNITLKSGQLYHGEPGAVLRGNGVIFTTDEKNSHDIAIDGLTFDGGTVQLIGAGTAAGQADRLTVVNSTFRNMSLDSTEASLFLVYAKNSKIRHNDFTGIKGGSAILSYHLDNSSISYNLCTNTYQCIGMNFEGVANTGRNNTVSYNAGTGVERMAIEISDLGPGQTPKGSTRNLLVEGNWFSDWATTYLTGERFAYSIVCDMGIGTVVRNNYASCGTGTSAGHCDIAIELAGEGALATENYVIGFNNGTEVYQPNSSVTKNNYVNMIPQCTGNGCVNLYAPQGVNSSNTTISGNTSDASKPIPPKPVN